MKRNFVAFTLAETLITLGIIGVVAALTLPTVVNKVQSIILKRQFQKAYSTLYNAIRLVQAQNEAPVSCYYWEVNPYEANGNGAICLEENEYGSCKKWELKDGSSMPANYNGNMSDCKKFTEDFMKVLKVVKFCEKEALKNGCLPENYYGVDVARKKAAPNKEQDPNSIFSDSNIKNKYPTFITADGVLYIRYCCLSGSPVFTFDVNGHKGPNKWGYDIFSFQIDGNSNDGMSKIHPLYYAVEKGGKSMAQMIKEF